MAEAITAYIGLGSNLGDSSGNIEKAHEEAVTIMMGNISYREQCRTSWDPVNKQIIRTT